MFSVCIDLNHDPDFYKVMFLHVCVILFTGGVGVSGQTPPPGPRRENPPPRNRQTPPPGRVNPPRPGRHPPRPGRPPPGTWQGEPPPGPGRENQSPLPERRLQHTVNERPVRILLECILVNIIFTSFCY